MKSRTIILIGGAPTTGKSTMAAMLSTHLNLPWISTDQIGKVMRAGARREDHPKLFNTDGYDAQRFLTEFSVEEIANKELESGEGVWPGIKALIENGYPWKKGFIVEGDTLLPHLIKRDFGSNEAVRAVFLVDEDADRIRDVVFNRGLWGPAGEYSDDLKPKEIEWVLDFSHKIKKEAEKYGYPCVEVSKRDDDMHAVLAALGVK